MSERTHKHQLLQSLLAPLLWEWGFEAVQQCLVEVQGQLRAESEPTHDLRQKPAKDTRRPSAAEIVDRLEAPAERKEALKLLAARFDSKTFLPTSSDLRHFLDLHGVNPGPIKHRQDSFKKLLEVLGPMSNEELAKLHSSGKHGGPTRLGPLSDAIKATGAAYRVSDQQSAPAVDVAPAESSAPGTREQLDPNPSPGNDAGESH